MEQPYLQIRIDNTDTAAFRIRLHDQQLEVNRIVLDLDDVVLGKRRI
jgi:hypothetical protein